MSCLYPKPYTQYTKFAMQIRNPKKGFTLINFLRKTINVHPGGFTLIELLVVITIVIIIGSIAVLTFNQSIVKSRDNRRKTDLQAIASALEIYYQKNNTYPCAPNWLDSDDSSLWITDSCNSFATLGSSYINNLPKDPKQDGNPVVSGSSTPTGYSYLTPAAGSGCPAVGHYYILAAGLEDLNDPDTDKNKNYQYCAGDLGLAFMGNRIDSNVYVIVSQ